MQRSPIRLASAFVLRSSSIPGLGAGNATTCLYGAEPLPDLGIPQWCGVQLRTHNFTPETLDHAHDLGFRSVRRGFYWNAVEKTKGEYGFSDYDETMAHAKKLGITVVGVLFGGNKLYEDDGQGGIQTDAGREGFAKFAAALAQHYQGHNVLRELWNEPNVRSFWRKDGKHNSDEFAREYASVPSGATVAARSIPPLKAPVAEAAPPPEGAPH